MLAARDRIDAPTGTVADALAHGRRLLADAPLQARAQAQAILEAVPDHPEAQWLLGAALRRSGDLTAARAVLERLAAEQPRSAATHYELGLTLSAEGEGKRSAAALLRAVELSPNMTEAWRALGDQMTLAGETQAADNAYAQHIRTSVHDPRLMEAAVALCDERLAVAEQLLRDHLKDAPTDVAAIRMLAEVGARLGRYGDAELLLERCLELAPGFVAARHNYAIVLHRQSKSEEVLAEVERLLKVDPRNPGYRNLKAAALARLGEIQGAVELYEGLVAETPNQPKLWLSYGHALKTAGRAQDSIAAYRKGASLDPGCGEAYWSLANLKTFRFAPEEVALMQAQSARADLGEEERTHLEFALGKALEDAGDFAESFAHYAQGNRLRRAQVGYEAADTSAYVARCKALFTKDFFAAREGWGLDRPDPIFIVGLPRSGSTLLEQILASHSQVEGTQELPEIGTLALELSGRRRDEEPGRYPGVLAEMDADQFRAMGQRFIDRTRIQRKTDRPFFIDKMPNNFEHIGLIRTILPRAKFIDARRHPLGACFSGFTQHFARGQNFTYSLDDLGLYYRDYVELMAHFDAVLPGAVHRVIYETVVEETEAEVRRLLDYCGLPFEDRCLRFWETERAVRTASSEQVRRPIFREGLDHWRNYEPWLDPLKVALGSAIETWSGGAQG
jgi:tetratricopeptide (TPR) repeat protein